MSQLRKLAHERAFNETREALKLTEDRLVVGVLLWGVWLFFVWMYEGKAARLKLLLSFVPLLIFPLVYAMKFVAAQGNIYDEAIGTNYRAAGTARSKGLISGIEDIEQAAGDKPRYPLATGPAITAAIHLSVRDAHTPLLAESIERPAQIGGTSPESRKSVRRTLLAAEDAEPGGDASSEA